MSVTVKSSVGKFTITRQKKLPLNSSGKKQINLKIS